jgi:hypothetical protein
MGIRAVIFTSALMIAAAIAVSLRFSIVVGPTIEVANSIEYPRAGIYRLDHWTGAVMWCATPRPISDVPGALPTLLHAARVNCEATSRLD